MNNKLTLSLDKEAIELGKQVARASGRSLSEMVESFFVLLGRDTQTAEAFYPISPGLQSLVGIGAGPFDEHTYRRLGVVERG